MEKKSKCFLQMGNGIEHGIFSCMIILRCLQSCTKSFNLFFCTSLYIQNLFLVASHSNMAFWGGKKELEEIKTGIGGKTVKRFSSVGGWKWTWDFFVHARRNNDRNFAEKKSKGFLHLGMELNPEFFHLLKTGICGK